MIRNDFYYKQLKETQNSVTIIDFLYSAKDKVSGDAYSARVIDENRTLFFVIDGMGKGLSASISAMIAVTHLNDLVDLCLSSKESFSLKESIEKAIRYIGKTLLEDEILSISFLLIDTQENMLEYATFSMPPILLLDASYEAIALKSNNPPISCYTKEFKTTQISYVGIQKLLIYSDGLVETSLKEEELTYSKYIKKDFKDSVTREEFRKKILDKVDEQEDDITFIFINHIQLKKPPCLLVIDTKLEETEKANEWFDDIVAKKTEDKNIRSSSGLAFMELLMNAYEHGNLGIDSKKKHTLIENDEYFDFLLKKELTCKKKIFIKVYSFKNYLLVKITDEGDGFDTAELATIFGLNKSYNKRGVLMSRNATLGIYYNSRANQVIFIAKL